MPELRVGEQHWSVAAGSNLLDALNQNGVAVPYSCRAGSCHACLVQCVKGLPADSRPDALSAEQRQQGWRLACQCQVIEDLQVHTLTRSPTVARQPSKRWTGSATTFCACA